MLETPYLHCNYTKIYTGDLKLHVYTPNFTLFGVRDALYTLTAEFNFFVIFLREHLAL